MHFQQEVCYGGPVSVAIILYNAIFTSTFENILWRNSILIGLDGLPLLVNNAAINDQIVEFQIQIAYCYPTCHCMGCAWMCLVVMQNNVACHDIWWVLGFIIINQPMLCFCSAISRLAMPIIVALLSKSKCSSIIHESRMPLSIQMLSCLFIIVFPTFLQAW